MNDTPQAERRVLLTGASGFIGRHAAVALAKAGVELHLTSRSRPPVDVGVWHQADLLEPEAITAVVSTVRPHVVLHAAWCVEHGRFWTDPNNLNWVAATMCLVRAAVEVGASRFVGLGTCYEYDWPENGICDEFGTPVAGHTLYDISKDATRRVLDAYCREVGIGFAWARLFFLYGPDEAPMRLVASVARALARGEDAVLSSGTAVRDFTDVRDAGAALSALALSGVEGPVNIGSGDALAVNELAKRLGELAGRPNLIKLGVLPDRKAEPPRILAATKRLCSEVGYESTISLDEGLRNVLDFWASSMRKS